MRTSTRVRAERKPQRVRTALRNTLREVLLLARLRLGNLLLVEVALVELLVERLEVKTLDDVDRVDDVSERLRHLAPVRVADHGVAVDLAEGHLVGELEAELLDTTLDSVPACQAVSDRNVARKTEVLRLENLVGGRVVENGLGVNTRLVRKRTIATRQLLVDSVEH